MSTAIPTRAPEEARVEQFAERLLGIYTDGVVALMIDLASRTGLLDALAAGPDTSHGLAARGACTSATSASASARWSPPRS